MNKKTLATATLIAILAFTIGYLANPLAVHFDPKVNVYMEVVKGEGTSAAATLATGNLITDIGETFLGESAFLGTDANGTWAISLSNDGSSSAAWTELPNEVDANGFSRTAAVESAVWSNGGDWAVNFTCEFTASGTQQLQTAGFQWGDTPLTDNDLFAAADFTQTTFEADDTLTVKWVITVNAN